MTLLSNVIPAQAAIRQGRAHRLPSLNSRFCGDDIAGEPASPHHALVVKM
jgi:hypothetical protein